VLATVVTRLEYLRYEVVNEAGEVGDVDGSLLSAAGLASGGRQERRWIGAVEAAAKEVGLAAETSTGLLEDELNALLEPGVPSDAGEIEPELLSEAAGLIAGSLDAGAVVEVASWSDPMADGSACTLVDLLVGEGVSAGSLVIAGAPLAGLAEDDPYRFLVKLDHGAADATTESDDDTTDDDTTADAGAAADDGGAAPGSGCSS
jgi:hypothetical protein